MKEFQLLYFTGKSQSNPTMCISLTNSTQLWTLLIVLEFNQASPLVYDDKRPFLMVYFLKCLEMSFSQEAVWQACNQYTQPCFLSHMKVFACMALRFWNSIWLAPSRIQCSFFFGGGIPVLHAQHLQEKMLHIYAFCACAKCPKRPW